MVKILQGNLYSTAFRLRDQEAFDADPQAMRIRQKFNIFSGTRDNKRLHRFTSRGALPPTDLYVARPAILGLLKDAGASAFELGDTEGWIALLQRHLHPDDGIFVITDDDEGAAYQTYRYRECADWTR